MRRLIWLLIMVLSVASTGCSKPVKDSKDSPGQGTDKDLRGDGGLEEDSRTLGMKGWELKKPEPDAGRVEADKPREGFYPVGSRIRDKRDLGGFGGCSNFPFELGEEKWGAKGGVSVVAFPDEPVACQKKYRGIAVRIINRGENIARFKACDSCVYLVQEALDSDGHWREIESSPMGACGGKCGNSYHHVFLKRGQYWQVPAPLFSGSFETKLRFRLDPTGDPRDKPIYSNEFQGTVALGQLRLGEDRAVVLRALNSRDPKTEGLIQQLAGFLTDKDAETRASAAMKLAEFGAAAKEAVSALESAMNGPDKKLRRLAAYALWRVDGQVEQPLKTLIAGLEAEEELYEKRQIVLWLREMGPAGMDSAGALCKLLPKADRRFRAEIYQALGAIQSATDDALTALTAGLQDPDWYVRAMAAGALGDMGADAKSAVGPLSELLKDTDGMVQVDAALALWKIQKKAGNVVPRLIELLKREPNRDGTDSYVASAAAEVLGKIGPAAKDAVPQLMAALKKREARIHAAGALWYITGKAEPTVATLSKVIQESDNGPNESNMHDALKILDDMGAEAKNALPALRTMYKRCQFEFEREEIRHAVNKMDKEAGKELN